MTTTTGEPQRRSYSQLRQWQECPKRFELERVHLVPSRPAVYYASGRALHSAVEQFLLTKIKGDQ